MKPQYVINWLTLIVSVAWVISFGVRLFHSWEGSTIADTAMLLVLGFWFSTQAVSSVKNGKTKAAEKAEETP